MEYTYEFLRKCHGLRFRATINNKPQEGIIKVMSEGVVLCYGKEDPGFLVTFGRRDALSFSEQTFAILPGDFEIIPRDPDTYIDWQVGDQLSYGTPSRIEVIFRFGKLVICVNTSDGYVHSFRTCRELFDKGYHLVLTDIEKQIIKERETAEWKPQDGDIFAWKTNKEDEGNAISIYKERHRGYATLYTKNRLDVSTEMVLAMNIVRSATDEEKQRLFDALAKEGKRWNAEKKVVEDIPKPFEFKKFDPVLVRDSDGDLWRPRVFDSMRDNGNSMFKYTVMGRIPYAHCIPLNEKTMHLLGTSNNYEEE